MSVALQQATRDALKYVHDCTVSYNQVVLVSHRCTLYIMFTILLEASELNSV